MNEEEKNPKLENALRVMSRERIFVPPDADEKVAAAIREHFGAGGPQRENDLVFRTQKRKDAAQRIPVPHRKLKNWHKWMPLAASIGIAATILYFSRPLPDRADINRDGTVDVIDALLLAEKIRAGEGQDIDGDRTVSEADAAEIATRAVALERTRS